MNTADYINAYTEARRAREEREARERREAEAVAEEERRQNEAAMRGRAREALGAELWEEFEARAVVLPDSIQLLPHPSPRENAFLEIAFNSHREEIVLASRGTLHQEIVRAFIPAEPAAIGEVLATAFQRKAEAEREAIDSFRRYIAGEDDENMIDAAYAEYETDWPDIREALSDARNKEFAAHCIRQLARTSALVKQEAAQADARHELAQLVETVAADPVSLALLRIFAQYREDVARLREAMESEE